MDQENNKLKELQSTLGKIEVALGVISDAIVWTDQSGRIQWCNKSFDDLIGTLHILNLGKSLVKLLPLKEHGTLLPDDGHPVNRVLQEKKRVEGYYEYVPDDKIIYLQFLGHHLEMPDANETAVIVIRDITGEKNLEQIKLQSAALHHAANAIAITDHMGAVKWVNRSFKMLTGYTLQEVYGHKLNILKSGKHDEIFYRNLWETILSGNVWHGETVNRKKDDSLYIEEQIITPVKSGDGVISHFIAIKEDISERKKTEEELEDYRRNLEHMVNQKTRELEKAQREIVKQALEAGMAQMAAIGLHNIGNAITPINVIVEQLKTGELADISRYLKKCHNELETHSGDLGRYLSQGHRGQKVFGYMGELIDSLCDHVKKQFSMWEKMESALSYISQILTLQQFYAGGSQDFKERVDLNDIFEEALRLQMGVFEKRKIVIKRNYTKPLRKLLIDKNKLMQVIVNLIKNSCEAIDAQALDLNAKVIEINTFSKKAQLGFEIRDSGIGVDPGEIDNIFKLGKSIKGSTGFGLYYCKIFIESSNGKLIFLSQGSGKGASVQVIFDINEVKS